MTENEYLLAGNLARIRVAVSTLRDVIIVDDDKNAAKCRQALKALYDVMDSLADKIPPLEGA